MGSALHFLCCAACLPKAELLSRVPPNKNGHKCLNRSSPVRRGHPNDDLTHLIWPNETGKLRSELVYNRVYFLSPIVVWPHWLRHTSKRCHHTASLNNRLRIPLERQDLFLKRRNVPAESSTLVSHKGLRGGNSLAVAPAPLSIAYLNTTGKKTPYSSSMMVIVLVTTTPGDALFGLLNATVKVRLPL